MKEITFEEIRQQLLDGKITPEEYVTKYNELLTSEVEKHQLDPPQPHEHI